MTFPLNQLPSDLLLTTLSFLDPIEAAKASSVSQTWNEVSQDPCSPKFIALQEFATFQDLFSRQPKETSFPSPHPDRPSKCLFDHKKHIAWSTVNSEGTVLLYLRDKNTLIDSDPIDITRFPDMLANGIEFGKVIFESDSGVGPFALIDINKKKIIHEIDLSHIFNQYGEEIGETQEAYIENDSILFVTDEGWCIRWDMQTKSASIPFFGLPDGFKHCILDQVIKDPQGNFLFFRGTIKWDFPFISYLNLRNPTQRLTLPYFSDLPIACSDSFLFIVSALNVIALKINEKGIQVTPYRNCSFNEFNRNSNHKIDTHIDWTHIQTIKDQLLVPLTVVRNDRKYRLKTAVWDPWEDRISWHIEENGDSYWRNKRDVPNRRVNVCNGLHIWKSPDELCAVHNATRHIVCNRKLSHTTLLHCVVHRKKTLPHNISVYFRKEDGTCCAWLFNKNCPQAPKVSSLPLSVEPSETPTPPQTTPSTPVQPPTPRRTLCERLFTWISSFALRERLHRISSLFQRFFCCRRSLQ